MRSDLIAMTVDVQLAICNLKVFQLKRESVYKHIPGTIHLSLESGLQRYGTHFFCQKNGKKNFVETKSYRVTELQSYNPSLPGMRGSKL